MFKVFEGEIEEIFLFVDDVFYNFEKEIVRKMIVEEGKCFDGRKFDEIRFFYVEVGILLRIYGFVLFKRGYI